MKTRACLAVAKEFLRWLDDNGSLTEIEFLIGDKLHLLSKSLLDSFVCDASGRLCENVEHEEAILAFMVYLSMRYAILKQVSPSVKQK